uniref:Regulator of microtubule dynamics protein 1 n=2 Tax=Timema bartmani TaxID=61472 RepID=A0A7R9I1K6_9NEOP|nr:unnamed protein product [Timema bartmani]
MWKYLFYRLQKYGILYRPLLRKKLYYCLVVPSKMLPRVPMGAKWLPVFGFLNFFSSKTNKPELDDAKSRLITEALLNEADSLFDENKFAEIYELLLPSKDSNNVEVLWRLSRALYKMSKQVEDKEQMQHLIFEAHDIIQRALQCDASHFAVHKWCSVLLDARAACEGVTERINQLVNVKNHMLKAIELNPKDATTLHMLGVWCFSITDMPWYQRQIARTFFATPPTSTYEEALQFFSKAEEVDPQFYSQNLLMLGKTYLRINDLENARHYLYLASTYPTHTDDDIKAKKEASDILKEIKTN